MEIEIDNWLNLFYQLPEIVSLRAVNFIIFVKFPTEINFSSVTSIITVNKTIRIRNGNDIEVEYILSVSGFIRY